MEVFHEPFQDLSEHSPCRAISRTKLCADSSVFEILKAFLCKILILNYDLWEFYLRP